MSEEISVILVGGGVVQFPVPQCCRWPLFYLLPNFYVLVKNTSCTSSTLQKTRSQEEGSPLLLNISSFCFVCSSSLFAHQQYTKFILNILNSRLSCTAHIWWIQHISVAMAPITRDLLSGYLHNPHGSTPQPPGGNASCEEHLLNLSLSGNGASVSRRLHV